MGKQRTITLTSSRPVTIDEDQWPVIAKADWDDYDSQYESEANRKAAVTVRIRQHQDGRAIVYGTYRFSTLFGDEDDVRAAAGSVLDAGSDIITAIRETVDYLASYESLPESWQPDWKMLADDCIADLPAEKL